VFVLRAGASLAMASSGSAPGASARKFRTTANIADGAVLRMSFATIGESFSEHTVKAIVTGDRAECSLDWVILARGGSRIGISTEVIFEGREGRGETMIAGVAEGTSAIRCDGSVRIGPRGTGTATFLTERFLILDSAVKIDATPELGIGTNDVKAGHAATITRVSEDDLFYLLSRGIGREPARQLLIEGFLQSVLGRIGEGEMAERIRDALKRATIDSGDH
jgi:Fe-S cluster assembly protein SufD